MLEKEVIPKESYNRDSLIRKMEEEAEKVREELEAKFPQGETKETYKSKVTRIFRGKKK